MGEKDNKELVDSVSEFAIGDEEVDEVVSGEDILEGDLADKLKEGLDEKATEVDSGDEGESGEGGSKKNDKLSKYEEEENSETAVVDEIHRKMSGMYGDDVEEDPDYTEIEEEVEDIEIIYDKKGNPVTSQVDGEYEIDYIALDKIVIPPRGKLFLDDVMDLAESIKMWGLVDPLHVIPFNDKYILLHGYRRYLALKELGREVAIAVVDSTRPRQVVRYLEAIANSTRKYNFIEMMGIGRFIEERQNSFSSDTIENILQLPVGHYYKAKYIDDAKEEFDEIYTKVVRGVMDIESAYKKIEKERKKADEESENDLNELEGDSYEEPIAEEKVQESGKREKLDPALRKYIMGRDHYTCQCCGMGKGEPDLASIFEVHHIIPVKHRGADARNNLVLLCPNCHGYVTAYDEDRFKPAKDLAESYSTIYNVVLLGNICKRGIPKTYAKDGLSFYNEKAKKHWEEE